MNTQSLDTQWQNLSAEKKQKALDLLTGEFISKRTKAALKELKKPRKLGRPPFGYKYVNGTLVDHMDESATMSRMMELRKAGCNYTSISKTLNLEGKMSQTGKTFTPQMVRNIIHRTQSVTLSRMMELRDLGHNPNQIMKILNDEERPSSTGKKWTRNSVVLVLSRHQPIS